MANKSTPGGTTSPLPQAARPAESHRVLLAGSALMFATFASANVLPAVCLVQIAAQFGLSDAQCGLLFAVGPSITFVALPLFGLLAERFGKRWLLAGGMAMLAAALEVYRVADGYGVLLLGAATMGMASAVFDALGSPLVVDLYPRRTAPVMNLIHGCFQIGLVITSVGVGYYLALGGPWPGALVPALLLAAALAGLFAIARFPPAVEREAPHGVASLLRQGPFWLCAIGMAVAGGVEAGVVN
jgi:predicted MFS family arabinose efflux permease